ncbi:PREDICTED: mediator of RNA polymerase II transcription subunit 15-like [Diuraphis noxia]|uniref:mediator of RNA polymerase II transcription subunit 15-like n=1 Tax=Diuraphis noxia TaxID=143948 RepID=UPI000763975A|nr:PREDICTED: mediator of RNA polymerase II transcription subunit 15-like [Diuraphis noxia]
MEFVSACLVLMVAVLHGGVLSELTENNYDEKKFTLENVSSISKRQTNFQNDNLNQQQIPQTYFDYIQQENYDGNLVPEQQQFGQQNVQQQFGQQNVRQFGQQDVRQFGQQNVQQQVFVQGSPSDVFPPTTTTTLSPFTAEQVRLQEEYARRTLVEQQTALIRSRQRPLVQPLPTQFQIQPSSIPEQQQSQPLQFIDQSGQVRQQNFVPQQQDLVSQQQTVLPVSSDEPFSYAQVQFGPVAKQEETVVSRPKGQRSVSRPRINYAVEPVTQQTIDYSAVTKVNPVPFSSRLPQNVVYIQPNGQMYKAIEDTEPVVQIPRKNHYTDEYQTISAVTSGPTTSATSLKSSTTTVDPIEEEQVVLIPRPKKLNQRPRQESRKSSRVQQQVVRTERPQHQQDQQLPQSSEVEPDNFLTSLLSRFQQTQPETTVAALPKLRGSQRAKSGNRSGTSKYLPDRSQLQLLQFPHELKALTTAELKVLEETSARIAAANDKSVEKKQLLRDTPDTDTASHSPSSNVKLNERFILGNRPVPMPVELSEQQRQFLAAQGIRNLYRVDYDQSGNELPLTYVLALDNRPKLAELKQKL